MNKGMKRFITWLYKKYVFTPELLSFEHTKDRWHWLLTQNLDFVDDIEMLNDLASYGLDPELEVVSNVLHFSKGVKPSENGQRKK